MTLDGAASLLERDPRHLASGPIATSKNWHKVSDYGQVKVANLERLLTWQYS